MTDEILYKQKHFPMGFFAAWLMIITTVQWIMIDMYLPALPVLKEYFHVSESVLNISLNAGLVATAIGTLVSGTLSDKYGRKGLLLLGLLVSIASNVVCALAGNVWLLCIMRGFGGLGSGFILSIITAIIKDSFAGRQFQKTMTILQSVAVVGPVIAPTLGSFIINYTSWRMIFVFLAVVTAITMVPMFWADDTCPKEARITGSTTAVFRDAFGLFHKKSFTLLIGVICLLTMPVWAYVGVSSYIYIEEFGMTNIQYGIYYAVAAVVSCLSPFIYAIMAPRTRTNTIVVFTFVVLAISGIGLLFTGQWAPWCFLLCTFGLMIAEGVIRPLGAVLILEDNANMVGSASSIMHFTLNVIGIVGTSIATLSWHSMVFGLGVISTGCVILAIFCWVPVVKGKLIQHL